ALKRICFSFIGIEISLDSFWFFYQVEENFSKKISIKINKIKSNLNNYLLKIKEKIVKIFLIIIA
ncbi:hypothetical protein BpHYR1_018407, partial [Brachionus plicatilis]